MTLKQEVRMWELKKNQFVGKTEKEVIEYMKKNEVEYEYTPETYEDYGYITIGKEYEYSDHYEILFSDGECVESGMIIWD